MNQPVSNRERISDGAMPTGHLREAVPAARWGRPFLSLMLSAVGMLLGASATRAQVYPQELYGGVNVISVFDGTGIARIEVRQGWRWVPMRTGQTFPSMKIITAPTVARCPKKATFTVLVQSNRRPVTLQIRVVDCSGAANEHDIGQEQYWNVSPVNFGVMQVGERSCRRFEVTALAGRTYVVDSISSPSRLFTIRYTGVRPPLRITNGSYYYTVCFEARRAGVYRMPIFVHVRRSQPAGGYTTFIVADTAMVAVIAPTRPRVPRPPPQRPTPPVVVPKVEPPPPPPPDIVEATPRDVEIDLPVPDQRPPEIASIPIVPPEPPPPGDPTTFRTILLPTARSIDSGKFFVATYDLLGWLAGWGAADRVSLTLGGLYAPGILGGIVDVTGGVKYEAYSSGAVRAAAGVQLNYSRTDSSTIALAVPYVVGSLGDDDSRASAIVGYSIRRHEPASGAPFGQQSLVVSIGGDHRIGSSWKIASELTMIEGSRYHPLIVTGRWFDERWAVDLGIAVNAGYAVDRTQGLQIAPVLSVVHVW